MNCPDSKGVETGQGKSCRILRDLKVKIRKCN